MWLGSMERMNAEFLRVQKLTSVPGGMSPPKYTRSRSVLRRMHHMQLRLPRHMAQGFQLRMCSTNSDADSATPDELPNRCLAWCARRSESPLRCMGAVMACRLEYPACSL